MTIQLELDFLPSYAFSAADDLYLLAVSFSSIIAAPFSEKEKYFYDLQKLQRQAIDLKNYAFLHDFIDGDEYAYLSKLIIDSSDRFWR